MTEATETTVGWWRLSGDPTRIELPGMTIDLTPTVVIRPIPGLRWLGPILAGLLDLKLAIRCSPAAAAPRGFTYDQVMARSDDRRLMAAPGQKKAT
ncbi:MAG: hypothetical protein PHU85_00080 [Phycisphaerae bacterium]|nr:hypothetical protein [Phycisphaerae bacterium]